MSSGDTHPIVRWIVIVSLAAATLAMAAVSLRANFLFGYGFGQTPEKAFVFGWANVAADIWKVIGLTLIMSLWRAKRHRVALMLLPIWCVCLGWGLTGAVGIYAQDRSTLIGNRAAVAATYHDKERELAALEQKARALGAQRSVEQIDAAIATVLARPIPSGDRVRGTVGKLSNGCNREEPATARACLEVATLREERAAAQSALVIEQRLAVLRSDIAAMRAKENLRSPDPIAELFAWLSRGQLDVRDIAFGFPLAFAILVELVSALGPPGIIAYAEATRRPRIATTTRSAASGRGELAPAVAGSGKVGRVIEWMAERTEPAGNLEWLAVSALYADYQAWCTVNCLQDLSAIDFCGELERVRHRAEVDGKIKKSRRGYSGLRLLIALPDKKA